MSNKRAVLSTVPHSRFVYTSLDPACFWQDAVFEGRIMRDPCTGKRCLRTRDPKSGKPRILVDDDNTVLFLHRDGLRVRISNVGGRLRVTELK